MKTTNQHNQESNESHSPTAKWAADSTLFWLFIVTLAAIILSTYSRAGTYNFYLNNTEQGDSGNSSPSISVKEKKANKKKIETVPAEEVEDTGDNNSGNADDNNDSNQYDATEPSSDDDWIRRKKKLNQGVTAKKDPSLYLPEEPKFQRWRLGLTLQYVRQTEVSRFQYREISESGSRPAVIVSEYTDIIRHPMLEFGFYFNRYFGINLGLGQSSVLDLEVIPVSAPDQSFEWAVMIGTTTPVKPATGTFTENILWHVGTRVNLQLTPFGGLTTSIRWAPRTEEIYPFETQSVYDSFNIGAGLFIRF